MSLFSVWKKADLLEKLCVHYLLTYCSVYTTTSHPTIPTPRQLHITTTNHTPPLSTTPPTLHPANHTYPQLITHHHCQPHRQPHITTINHTTTTTTINLITNTTSRQPHHRQQQHNILTDRTSRTPPPPNTPATPTPNTTITIKTPCSC